MGNKKSFNLFFVGRGEKSLGKIRSTQNEMLGISKFIFNIHTDIFSEFNRMN